MTLRQTFVATFRECCTNLSCAPFYLLALVFYSFYYCWPYTAQLPDHMTTAIVDEDHSPLSRRLIQGLAATPRLNVRFVTQNRQEAIAAMQDEEVVAIVGIPPNFERDAMAGIPVGMTLVANGAFIVRSRSSIAGADGPLLQAATEAVAAEMARNGVPQTEIAAMARNAPPLVIQPMYNNISGYLNFVVPIVFMVIFQTLMLCGTGMLFHSLFGRKPFPRMLVLAVSSPSHLLAMQMPVFCICFFWSLMVEGTIFSLHGINSFQNIPATICMGMALSLAISSLGILAGLVFRSSWYAIQAIVVTSLPSVFISGNLYPAQNIPIYMRMFSWIFPSTPGSTGMVRASQAGASVSECMPYILHLLALALLYFALELLVCRRMRKPDPEKIGGKMEVPQKSAG